MTLFDDLKAEFPRSAISWRAQSVKKDGTSALALAYIDARDVMNRLDDIVGAQHWQDRYEVHGSKTICYISIEVEQGQWVTKADGAGDSDIEAEKGSLSDAFKRCAVKWGIGRYLYDIPAPWVPCKAYESEWNGKKKWNWQSWSDDPWKFVKSAQKPVSKPVAAESTNPTPEQPSLYKRLSVANSACVDKAAFNALWGNPKTISAQSKLTDEESARLETEKANKFSELEVNDPSEYHPPNFDDLPEPTQQAVKNLGA